MNWKDKLELEYKTEEDNCFRFKQVGLFCYWHGYLLLTKRVMVKTKHFD